MSTSRVVTEQRQLQHFSYPRLEHLEVLQLLGDRSRCSLTRHTIYDMLYAFHSKFLHDTQSQSVLPFIPSLEVILVRQIEWRSLRVQYRSAFLPNGLLRDDRIRLVEENLLQGK